MSGWLTAVAVAVGIAGAQSFHLHVGHAHPVVASDAGDAGPTTACRPGGGCCRHAPVPDPVESDPAEAPSDQGSGDCDACTMLAALGSTVQVAGPLDLDASIVEYLQTPRCTTKDVWGPARAISRGPPRLV